MKLYIQTYGCQMNEHDSSRMVQVMGPSGYQPTGRVEEADLILINTCSVRDKAEQKLYSALGRLRQLKESRPEVVIGVCGCVAQQEKERLLRRAPHVDLVLGTHNIHKLPEMVWEARDSGKRGAETRFHRDPFFLEPPDGSPQVAGPKAYITIMQGCDKVCSFCIVPYVRGREISRPGAKILEEIRSLASHGVREVMLLGQNVNSYGKSSPEELTFPLLLERINDIDGVERIRFTTSHPQDLSPELIEAYSRLEKLCPHLHLPVQSGSDSVLRRMRRGYTRNEYRERIARLRDRCPGIALSTDIIVGFPGETDAEFEATLEILREIKYDDAYLFMYSPRPQTLSAKIYGDDVPEGSKRLRLQQVQALQGEISLRKNLSMVGSAEEVLFEGEAKLGHPKIRGRTRRNKIVNAAGPVDLVGTTARVRITGASANSLLGDLVGQAELSERTEQRGMAS